MAILVAVKANAETWAAHLRGALPGRTVLTHADDRARAAVSYVASWKHAEHALRDLPNLKAIFSLGAGVEHLVNDPDLPDVPIIRLIDQDLVSRMSEYVVQHCLMHLRGGIDYARLQRERRWCPATHQPAARDVRVGILGLGNLGRDAATKLAVMGFQVMGWSRSPKQLSGVMSFHGERGLDEMVRQSDILVSLLPLTPETRGILAMPLFKKLPRDGRIGPVLINAGRGGSQVEADLVAALDEGALKGASLDVFETEPLPSSSRLWDHPLVIITPHVAADSDPQATAHFIALQIGRLEAGQVPDGVVDRASGY